MPTTAAPARRSRRAAVDAPALFDLVLLEQLPGQLTVDEVLDDIDAGPAQFELLAMCPGHCPGDYLEQHRGQHMPGCSA